VTEELLNAPDSTTGGSDATQSNAHDAWTTPYDNKPMVMAFFVSVGIVGLSTDRSPLGKSNRIYTAYAWIIQALQLGVCAAQPYMYWNTDGYGWWAELERAKVPQNLMTFVKVGDMTTVIAGSSVYLYGMCVAMNRAYRPRKEGLSVLDSIWTTRTTWRSSRCLRILAFQPLIWVSICEFAIYMSVPDNADSYYSPIFLGILLPGWVMLVSTCAFAMVLVRNLIDDLEMPLEDGADPQAVAKLIHKVHLLQTTWLDQGGLLEPFTRCVSILAGFFVLVILVDVMEISILQSSSVSAHTSSKSIKQVAEAVLLQLFLNFVALCWVLVPPLLITSAADLLYAKVNDLVGSLTTRAATAIIDGREQKEKDRLQQDLWLLDHLKMFMQDLNRKQGIGCAIFGVKLSVPLVKAVFVAMTSIFAICLPKCVEFYYPPGNNTALI